MSTLGQDLRYGTRMLVTGGSVSVVAVLTLALGIGANTAIFSIVNGILLKPLPYERPDELVLVTERHGERPISVAWMNYVDWKAFNRVFSDMAASNGVFLTLTRSDAERQRDDGDHADRAAGDQRANAVAQILAKSGHDSPPAGWMHKAAARLEATESIATAEAVVLRRRLTW